MATWKQVVVCLRLRNRSGREQYWTVCLSTNHAPIDDVGELFVPTDLQITRLQ